MLVNELNFMFAYGRRLQGYRNMTRWQKKNENYTLRAVLTMLLGCNTRILLNIFTK